MNNQDIENLLKKINKLEKDNKKLLSKIRKIKEEIERIRSKKEKKTYKLEIGGEEYIIKAYNDVDAIIKSSYEFNRTKISAILDLYMFEPEIDPTELWDSLDTTIYRVIDVETNENMGNALVRQIKENNFKIFLYNDEMDGFSLVSSCFVNSELIRLKPY